LTLLTARDPGGSVNSQGRHGRWLGASLAPMVGAVLVHPGPLEALHPSPGWVRRYRPPGAGGEAARPSDREEATHERGRRSLPGLPSGAVMASAGGLRRCVVCLRGSYLSE
jgi:hypothetical protein